MSESVISLRKIIHIDMDAFYASVEQRDNPDLKGKPIIVGGLPEGRGGVVATASYEARKYGVRSAMPSKTALRLCPVAIFIKPRFAAYKDVSEKIRAIFHRYTDLVEPLSLDEAYLDVTNDKLGVGSAIDIAKQIRHAIREELQLTASAGVSVNKFIAKLASDINKPDGLAFIGPSAVADFMEKLPVEKFYGVGKVTAEKMKSIGLHTGADLKKRTKNELIKQFGKVGNFYYNIVRGIDDRAVEAHRETRSISAEDTFPFDLTNQEEMYKAIDQLAATVARRVRQHDLKGRTVTLKIKYSDFKQITRNLSLSEATDDAETIFAIARKLLDATEPDNKLIRLLGVGISNFNEQSTNNSRNKNTGQLGLFEN
ncbi:MAG TPA: DNA polymerase IV [Puia sp.]|jgi:DNA polymerase-4